MPCLEITMPTVDAETRARLAARLTDAFDETTSFGRDIFGISFNHYEPGAAAVGGKLWNGEPDQPYLHLLLYSPRLGRSVKQKLVASLTAAFTEAVERPDWRPVIHLCEHPYDNVGVAGKLLCDSYEQCANSPFYYDLPKD